MYPKSEFQVISRTPDFWTKFANEKIKTEMKIKIIQCTTVRRFTYFGGMFD